MKADFHSHSTYSDGKSNIYELVKRAKEKGLDAFALTDHDTVFGCDEFAKLQAEFNIILIKGIELSCDYNGETVHVVGLFKNNIISEEMYNFSTIQTEQRKNRSINMDKKIKDIYNVDIDIDLLIKENKIITRKNIVNHLIKHNNLSLEEAKFLGSKRSKAYIPSVKIDLKEGLDLLHRNNALAILAHPCLIDNYLDEIIKMDFDGIEAKYANIKNDYNYFKNIADNRGFFISAGSDYHGDKSHGDIADVYLVDKEVELVLDKLGIKYDN